MLTFLFLLLPIAALTGWYAAYKHGHAKTDRNIWKIRDAISPDYLRGLNYLINEQPDKAVDVFIKMLEVNDDTVETHLALGSLFRRRGEVDRAIRIHQNLIARPQLSVKQRKEALSELGQDYLRAGLLDRAENLFLELINMKAENPTSYKYLLNIYQLQKDWQKAINIAKKLAEKSKVKMHTVIAHYYCELAEIAIAKDITLARTYLKKALAHDKRSVRAKMLYGKLAFNSGKYETAISYYHEIEEQDPDFLGEVLAPLTKCYVKLNAEEKLVEYLHKCLIKRPQFAILFALTEELKKGEGNKSALLFLRKKIAHYASLRGASYLLDTYIQNAESDVKDSLLLLQKIVTELSEKSPKYRCLNCGFVSKLFYWQCPGCRNWGTIKPIVIKKAS